MEAAEGDLGRNPSVANYRDLDGLFPTFDRKKIVVTNLKTDADRLRTPSALSNVIGRYA